jgi:hypothetical protein
VSFLYHHHKPFSLLVQVKKFLQILYLISISLNAHTIKAVNYDVKKNGRTGRAKLKGKNAGSSGTIELQGVDLKRHLN